MDLINPEIALRLAVCFLIVSTCWFGFKAKRLTNERDFLIAALRHNLGASDDKTIIR